MNDSTVSVEEEKVTTLQSRIDNLVLSPSSVSNFNCPLKWYYKYLEKIPTKDSNASLVGEQTHKVLEIFMGLEPKFRTKKNLVTICAQECRKFSKERNHNKGKAAKFKKFVTERSVKIFDFVDPSQITVLALEKKVEGNIVGVQGHGVVDIIFEENNKKYVVDYKSGNLNEKYLEDNKEQIIFYDYLLEDETSYGSLIYLGYRKSGRHDFKVTPEMTEKMLEKFERTKQEIYVKGIQKENYEPNPSSACLGCSYSKDKSLCPQGYEKSLDIQKLRK